MAQVIRLRPAMGALQIVLAARRALLAATLPGGNVDAVESVAAIRSLVLRAPVSGGPDGALEMVRRARRMLACQFHRPAEWEFEQMLAIFTGASADATVLAERHRGEAREQVGPRTGWLQAAIRSPFQSSSD